MQHIFAFLSEFERFLKIFKNRKLRVMCALTFRGIVVHGKIIAVFKSQKITFFEVFSKELFERSKNTNFYDLKAATTFPCTTIPLKVRAHITRSFLFLKIFKKRSNSLKKAKLCCINQIIFSLKAFLGKCKRMLHLIKITRVNMLNMF